MPRVAVRPRQMVVKHPVTDDASVKWRDFGGCTIVTVPAEVDLGQVNEIRNSIAGQSGYVVLDIGAASRLQPSAATALAALHRSANAHGGGVCIVTKQVDVRLQLQHAAGGSAPPIFDEIGDALEASMAARQAAVATREKAHLATDSSIRAHV